MVVMTGFGALAGASTYTFTPSPADMYDLDHSYAYKWGIDWYIPQGETITSATLSIKNITNWDSNKNILYVGLLDNPYMLQNGTRRSVVVEEDNHYDNAYGDWWLKRAADTGSLARYRQLTTYKDLNGYATTENWSYSFAAADLPILAQYAGAGSQPAELARASFGITLDPDCHYYNDGIALTIVTTKLPPPPDAVPEPSTIVLVGSGLAGLGLAAWRRRKQS